jgi:hypothetical protein
MATRTLASAITLLLAAGGATALTRAAQVPQAAGYGWAESCRKCHEPVYDAWAKTKHASALGRLSAAEQETECVGCHLTGPRTRVFDGTKVLNAGVQCEACHGAAKAHVADPSVKAGLTRVPASELCEACHSDKSPRFKGFVYSAMVGLSHKTR